jgi:hypothetical protein
MKSISLIIIIGALTVILYDTAGSVASRVLGFAYSWLIMGSVIIYALFGYSATKSSGLLVGALTGALIGIVDATIGWYISWTIGPGQPTTEVNAMGIILTVFFVSNLAMFFGLIGGLFTKIV